MSSHEKHGIDYDFGNSQSYELMRYSLSPNAQRIMEGFTIAGIDIDRGQFDPAFVSAVEDVRKTTRQVYDEKTGKYFEIGEVNPDSPDSETTLDIGTYASSLTKNHGNVVEFAQRSTQQPGKRRLYVSSPGNGGTSYLDKEERKFLIDNDGKPTYFDVEAGQRVTIPTLQALGRVIANEGFRIDQISTDSSGGYYATGLMAELPEGDVENAFFKSRPNIANLSFAKLAAGMLVQENILRARSYSQISEDELAPHLWVDQAEEILGDDYGSDIDFSVGKTYGLGKLAFDTRLYKRGLPEHDIAIQSTALAMLRQPDAKLTYYFPENDVMYKDQAHEKASYFISQVGSRVVGNRGAEPSNIDAMVAPGSHVDHSFYPQMRMALERYAFSR